MTLLSILHRTSDELLQKYDEIIYMEKGEIVEQDPFKTLIENKSSFYHFYTIQNEAE